MNHAYFITALQGLDSKTFGFFATQRQAELIIATHGRDLVECKWSYIVIERYHLGLETIPYEVSWWKWVEKHKRWTQVKKPKCHQGTVCFAMP